jgi:TRAP-type C4-dicarboxylate transport system substrate-binding protein
MRGKGGIMKFGLKAPGFVLFCGLLTLFNGNLWCQKYTIKLATLAPEDSGWMDIMRKIDRDVRIFTDSEVGFKIYAGGVLGDEKDVLRKIRIGQLHAAGFTGVGMGDIASDVRVLDTPFLVRSYEEADFIYQKFDDYFTERFSQNGYELLGWTEIGFIYVFTKKPVSNLDELKKIKMWVWQGDPVAEASFKAFGLKSIPLSIIDVMTALQTNMVDGVYSAPLAIIALQWFTKVKYMMETPIANTRGAVLISNKMFQSLPVQHRKTLKNIIRKYMAQLTQITRQQNLDSIEVLQKNGVELLPAPDTDTLQTYYELGASIRQELVGKFYSQDILNQIELALKAFRETSGSW